MIDHVVFDIGRVLIHYDPEIPFRRHIPDPDERLRFFEEVCTVGWNIEQDRGRIWPDAEAELIARHPDKAVLVRAFRRDWHEMVPYAYDDSVAILSAVMDKGLDTTLLTNFASDTFVEAQAKFPFLKETRGVTVSGRVGLIKPDRAIYELHAAEFDLTPSRTLFIDDSAANVAGAEGAGWKAVQFTGAAQLARDLARHGIDVGT